MATLTLKQLQIGSESQEFIDARNLYKFLGSSREFATWVKARIKRGGFIEGKDFLTEVSKSGGRPSMEYNLTTECAIVIASNENTNKGREFVKFFIQKQKERESGMQNSIRNLTKENYEISGLLELKENEIAILQSKVNLLEAITTAKKAKYGLEEGASEIGVCQIKFCQRLRELGYLERKYEIGRYVNVPTQKAEGLIFKEIKRIYGVDRTQSFLTSRGYDYFKSKTREYFVDILNETVKRRLKSSQNITTLTTLINKQKEQQLLFSL